VTFPKQEVNSCGDWEPPEIENYDAIQVRIRRLRDKIDQEIVDLDLAPYFVNTGNPLDSLIKSKTHPMISWYIFPEFQLKRDIRSLKKHGSRIGITVNGPLNKTSYLFKRYDNDVSRVVKRLKLQKAESEYQQKIEPRAEPEDVAIPRRIASWSERLRGISETAGFEPTYGFLIKPTPKGVLFNFITTDEELIHDTLVALRDAVRRRDGE